jgi:hypothetical protein
MSGPHPDWVKDNQYPPATWPWKYRCMYCKTELVPVRIDNLNTFVFNCTDICMIYAELENCDKPMWWGGGEPYDSTKNTETFGARGTGSVPGN